MIDSEKILNDIMSKLNVIDVNDIPGIDLYMDQVTTFMDKHLKTNKRFDDDKVLTKTMINNYAKNDLLPAPVKKRYSKEHVVLLIFIYYFKSILSINDIKTILGPICNSYFDTNSRITIDDIYSTISEMEVDIAGDIRTDIQNKINISKEMFSDNSKKDKDFLQLYALISALSFDVYVKKQMIENIVDQIAKESSPSDKDSKKDKK